MSNPSTIQSAKKHQQLEKVAIRFAGDSGDGMQLVGGKFTETTAMCGNDFSTFPDFPAEIRAPTGSLPGVSGYQIHFSSRDIYTPGDAPDVLVAMNPAALKVNLRDLPENAILLVNQDAFNDANLKKAGYASNPLEDGSLKRFRFYPVPIGRLNAEALAKLGLPKKDAERCKNFFALGLIYWMFDRPMESTVTWIQDKFKKVKGIADANEAALKAGFFYGETTELIPEQYRIPQAQLEKGLYRKISGNEAAAIGFVAAAQLAGKQLFYGSYPITPASDILHELSYHKNLNVRTFQAEDEIAAMGATIGAAFGGSLALTGTSGPGVALKSEAIGLAVMTELPVVIVNVQRGGPSTGLPTKTEQADLFQAMFGRNGECPVIIVAPATPGECFHMAIEASRLALKFMSPVMYLSDGFLANSAEPWRMPKLEDLPRIHVEHPTVADNFLPYSRDPETLARPWALPGTPGLEHRIGGLEKEDGSGNVSYDSENHQHMVQTRAAKVAGVAKFIPPAAVAGPPHGDLLLVGWGGTYGSLRAASEEARRLGKSVAHLHLRYINPFPSNLGDLLTNYKRILVAELNCGQLLMMLRAKYLVDARGFNKVKGKPFQVVEVLRAIEEALL
ncbi:MAG: 2-oxoacid:acceptor oxidoreductase subunit alpha [Candidatus Wallbacteria bacterium]|nr:2-oxoacid:acceptor oxidoreductase subunit alpha [Candidatus Wallbacteria bacterium]